MIKIGSKVRIKTLLSDYYNLVGVVVQEFPSSDPLRVHFYVSFDDHELRKSQRPEIVLKSKKNTIYFVVKELELINVST